MISDKTGLWKAKPSLNPKRKPHAQKETGKNYEPFDYTYLESDNAL